MVMADHNDPIFVIEESYNGPFTGIRLDWN